ncbi:MAG: hypothetical protein ACREE2_11260 [Stellaceae bacterium]
MDAAEDERIGRPSGRMPVGETMALNPGSLNFFLRGTGNTTTLNSVTPVPRAGSVTALIQQSTPDGAVAPVFTSLMLTSLSSILPPLPPLPTPRPVGGRGRVQEWQEIGSVSSLNGTLTSPIGLTEGGLLEITVSAAYNGIGGSLPSQAANSFAGTVVVSGPEFGTLTLPLIAGVCIAPTTVLYNKDDSMAITLQTNVGDITRTPIPGTPYPCTYTVTPILWPATGNEFAFTLSQAGGLNGLMMDQQPVTVIIHSAEAQSGHSVKEVFNLVASNPVLPVQGSVVFSESQWNGNLGQIDVISYTNQD